MSGHSKWSKVKHQKATTDVVKSMAFTKAARAITIAVQEGGGIGDPVHNFHLRLAIEKARDVNMPKDNIERAIEKGMGVGDSAIEQIQYEAYGPGGVALVIEAATDNRQRTVSAIKNVLERAGGAIGGPGTVSYLFSRSGILTIPKGSHSFDMLFEAALESGADDVVETEDMFEVYAKVAALQEVKRLLDEHGIVIDNMEIFMNPKTMMPLPDDTMIKIDELVEHLSNLDDVQHVFTNV